MHVEHNGVAKIAAVELHQKVGIVLWKSNAQLDFQLLKCFRS